MSKLAAAGHSTGRYASAGIIETNKTFRSEESLRTSSTHVGASPTRTHCYGCGWG